MEVVTKYLDWVIGLIITLAIISGGIAYWNTSSPLMVSANRQSLEQSREIRNSEYSAFDNQRVSGSQILTAYRRYATQEPFYLYVQTNNGTVRNFGMQPSGSTQPCLNFDYTSGSLSTGTTSTCNINDEQVQEYGNQYYIPPQGRFSSKIIRDKNDVIVAIYFKAQ